MNSISEARRRDPVTVGHDASDLRPAGTSEPSHSATHDALNDGMLCAFARNSSSSGSSDGPSPEAFKIHSQYYGDGSALFLQRSTDVSAISIDDVHQGAIEDCYFMATIAGIANSPRGRTYIEGCMKLQPDGNVEVKLGDNTVVVDPTRLANGGAHFGGGRDANALYSHALEQWPAVLEAAYARYTAPNTDLKDAYSAIGNRGKPETPMRAFGMKPIENFPMNGSWATPPGSFVKNAFEHGKVVVVETPTDIAHGLRGDHAYTVVGIDGDNVSLRDPITGSTRWVSFDELQGMKRVTAGEIP